MQKIIMVKMQICGVIGIIGGMISGLMGGWDESLKILITFITVDYITEIIVAGVFKKSTKSAHGAMESAAGWRYISKKIVTLLIIVIAKQLDVLLGSDFIRNTAIIAYTSNEVLSILENAGLMGVPMPGVLKNAIDILQKEGNKNS